MSTYRIVCVEKVKSGDHHHLTHVGTGTDPAKATKRWTVAEVRTAIDNGDQFHTEDAAGVKADVEPTTCCVVKTIKTKGDAVKDNNLDNLRICKFAP